VLVELTSHHRDLRLRQPGDAELFDQLLHPPRGHPEQVADRDHADHCLLGTLRRSSSHSGKYEPDRSLGIANSIVPTRVSNSRSR
jgi:hypothetical protein